MEAIETTNVIRNMKATVTDSSDFPSTLKAAVSGDSILGMSVNVFTSLEFLEAEELEVIEFHSSVGYASYTSDLFPDHIFYADVYFSREGADWIPEGLQDPQLEIEIKNNLTP